MDHVLMQAFLLNFLEASACQKSHRLLGAVKKQEELRSNETRQ